MMKLKINPMKKNNDQWKLEEMEVTSEDEGKTNDNETTDIEETSTDD